MKTTQFLGPQRVEKLQANGRRTQLPYPQCPFPLIWPGTKCMENLPLTHGFYLEKVKVRWTTSFSTFLGALSLLGPWRASRVPEGRNTPEATQKQSWEAGLLSPALETLYLSQRRHSIRLATHNTMLQKVCSTGLLNTNPDTVRTNHLRLPSFGTGLPQSLNTAKVNLVLR